MKLQFVHFPQRNVWRIARKEYPLFRLWVPRWVWVTKLSVQAGISIHYTGYSETKEVIAEFDTKVEALEFVKMKYLTKRVVKETRDEEWKIESEIVIK